MLYILVMGDNEIVPGAIQKEFDDLEAFGDADAEFDIDSFFMEGHEDEPDGDDRPVQCSDFEDDQSESDNDETTQARVLPTRRPRAKRRTVAAEDDDDDAEVSAAVVQRFSIKSVTGNDELDVVPPRSVTVGLSQADVRNRTDCEGFAELVSLTWVDFPMPNRPTAPEPFIGPTEEQKDRVPDLSGKSEMEIFITVGCEWMSLWLQCSNVRGRKRELNFKDITQTEMAAYFGVRLHMHVKRLTKAEYYWTHPNLKVRTYLSMYLYKSPMCLFEYCLTELYVVCLVKTGRCCV